MLFRSGIPVMLHEQNSVVGKANKVVSRYASGIVTCYDKATNFFGGDKARQLGNPRSSLAARIEKDPEYFESLGLDPNLKTIMIVMGSLGSSSVNELMKEALSKVDPSLPQTYRICKDGSTLLRASFRSEEHTSELQSPDNISYAVFCLKKIFF